MPSFSPTQKSEPPITVDEAQSRVLKTVESFGTERVGMSEALGRVLSEDVDAGWDVPGADNSAMDGYAVRAPDTRAATRGAPVRLRVVGDVPAGSRPAVTVEEGQAARIMTGAPIPAGADAVVQVELTDGGSEEVLVYEAAPPGRNVRQAGEDIREGERVLRRGCSIGSGEIGVLATVGRTTILVGRRPRVAILSTGSELVDPGVRPAIGQVTNSNAFALAALVSEHGGEPHVVGRVADTREGTVEALRAALEHDIVLTSGGVSVGAYDFVKDAAAELGLETKFWRVAMKPGKPILFAVSKDGRMLFGLPGNPVSSMVGFHLFVVPAIRKGMGRASGLLPTTVSTRLQAPIKSKGDRLTYMRVRVRAEGGSFTASPMKAQGSGITTSMIGANGLAIVPEGTTSIAAGELVETILLGAVESA